MRPTWPPSVRLFPHPGNPALKGHGFSRATKARTNSASAAEGSLPSGSKGRTFARSNGTAEAVRCQTELALRNREAAGTSDSSRAYQWHADAARHLRPDAAHPLGAQAALVPDDVRHRLGRGLAAVAGGF